MTAPLHKPLVAAAMCIGAMALFGLIDNFMAPAAAQGGLWQFHLLRSLLAVGLLAGLAPLLGWRLRPAAPGPVALRTLCNGGAMFLYFGCLGFMPIAQVAAGLFTAPFWVVLFGRLWFGERVGLARLLWVALGFAGIVLALRPEAAVTGWTLLPVLSGALYGMGNLLTRHWLGREPVTVLLTWQFGVMGLMGLAGCLWLWLAPQPVLPGGDGFLTRGWVPVWGLFGGVIVVQALGSLIGVALSIRAYQLADPAMVAVCENTLLAFATFWAVMLWGAWPGPVQLAGLALIIAAGVAIAASARGPAPVTQDPAAA